MACVNGEYYHLLNKGVEGRSIFTSQKDFVRFRRGLMLFNTEKLTELRNVSEKLFLEHLFAGDIERLVDIVAYCLLGNHFHLLVRQRLENGVEQFLRKLVGGYTSYFNLKYKRKGVLFQGHTKIIHVAEENHLDHLPRYIVLNALDTFDRGWREHHLHSITKAKKALLAYQYSSLKGMLDRNADPILSHDLVDELIDRKSFLNEALSWGAADREILENVRVEL